MPQTFSHNFPFGRKYVLIRLTQYHWQLCISQFCVIAKGELNISTGSLGLQVPVAIAKFWNLFIGYSLIFRFGYRLPLISVARIFDWGGGQTTNHNAMTSSKIFKKGTFCGGKDIVEWKIWSRGLLSLNQDFGKGRGWKLTVKKRKCLT